jgi:hypothetical protein
MKGVALLVALSAWGVDYNVQTSEDGKREYVVQVEPELLKSLSEGQQIHSAVPPEAGQIERILIRVGMAAPRHSQANITAYRNLLLEAGRIASTDGRGIADPTASVFWAAKDKPRLDYNVRYGWQPDAQGVLSYFVQIDPVLLQQLAIGDEIRAGVDPAAGRIGKFVIQAGSEELPKIPGEPIATGRSDAASGRTRFSPSTAPGTSDLYPGSSKSIYGPGAATRDVVGPAPSSVAPGSVAPGSVAPGSVAPGSAVPLARTMTPLASTPDYGSAAAVEQPPLYPAPRSGSRASAGLSDAGANQSPPGYAGPSQPDYGQPLPSYGQSQPDYSDPRHVQPRGTLEPPPAQYGPPSYADAGQNQQRLAPQVGYPPAVNYAPPMAPQDRLASANRPATTTNLQAPLAAPQINPTSTTKPTTEAAATDSKPYLTMIITFALFVSIGANLYLGWTAGEYYSRYRLATERLRSASRA